MLRITKQTDYGIMLLARMASYPPNHWMTARDASRWSGLSLPMVSKILKSLARGRILHSHRGAGGGYSLARTLHETTVADVVRALEGPISMVECWAHPGQCEQEPICPVRVNWTQINREVERALERVLISHMVTAASPGLVTLETGTCEPRPV